MGKEKIKSDNLFPFADFKYKCSCGKSVLIPYNKDFKICPGCGRKVKKDGKSYFRDKIRQLLNRSENERFREDKRYYKFVYR